MTGSIKIGCMNCRGLSSNIVKRRDIFNKCRDSYDISFLVDTHCKKELETYWQAEWGYKAIFGSHTTSSRGVAILFRNTFSFEILGSKLDKGGNYVILDIKMFDQRMTVAAIYGPNDDKPDFYDAFQNDIENFGNTSIIVGGDWNLPQNYGMDTLNYLHNNNTKAQKRVCEMMIELDLIDVYRELYPDKKGFPGEVQIKNKLDWIIFW